MKKRFLTISEKLIKEHHPEINQTRIEEIKYGLEGIYLSVTKFIIILVICGFVGIIKEFFIFLLFYNIIRLFAFGLHAKKSSFCLISSIGFFVFLPLIAINIKISLLIKLLISLFCIIMMILYAPADTHKRPLINKKKRQKFKVLSSVVAVAYTTIALIINNSFLANSLLFSLLIEVILILPITYRIFNLPYKNYKNYISS